jgi:hypothetical protein
MNKYYAGASLGVRCGTSDKIDEKALIFVFICESVRQIDGVLRGQTD